jgi:hypothetical protein
MTRAMRPALAQAFRRFGLPLAWYYAITLALPVANGAARTGATFVGHAVVVLVIPPILIVLACVCTQVVAGAWRYRNGGAACTTLPPTSVRRDSILRSRSSGTAR